MVTTIPVRCKLNSKNDNTNIVCIAESDDIGEICKCNVYTDNRHTTWTISSWFTKNGYNGKGIGRLTLYNILNYLYRLYGKPLSIEYIWNGTNEYVFNWLTEHFDAVCKCPIAIQKTQSDDDWSSHIYILNTDKVLNYFNIE